MRNKVAGKDSFGATVKRSTGTSAFALAKGRYHAKCYDKDGNLKWEDKFDNFLTDVGLTAMLEQYLEGSAWSTGTIYMGLKDNAGTGAITDTMSSHAPWAELNISASSGIRQSVSLGAAAAKVKATDVDVSFSITSSGTVAGAFLVIGGTSANGNTTGTLFSVGNFTEGDRSVVNTDQLDISWSITLADS